MSDPPYPDLTLAAGHDDRLLILVTSPADPQVLDLAVILIHSRMVETIE
jgi:hypothetical protein